MGRSATDLSARGPFGTLRAQRKISAKGPAKWVCFCDPELGGCGRTKDVFACSLVRGHTKSCGCKQGGRRTTGYAPLIME